MDGVSIDTTGACRLLNRRQRKWLKMKGDKDALTKSNMYYDSI